MRTGPHQRQAPFPRSQTPRARRHARRSSLPALARLPQDVAFARAVSCIGRRIADKAPSSTPPKRTTPCLRAARFGNTHRTHAANPAPGTLPTAVSHTISFCQLCLSTFAHTWSDCTQKGTFSPDFEPYVSTFAHTWSDCTQKRTPGAGLGAACVHTCVHLCGLYAFVDAYARTCKGSAILRTRLDVPLIAERATSHTVSGPFRHSRGSSTYSPCSTLTQYVRCTRARPRYATRESTPRP